MEFNKSLENYVNSIKSRLKKLNTEEATKHALVLPFLNLLGYDVYDPSEIVPEYVADVGVKKGEKVDYAVFKNNKLSILIECKKYGEDLKIAHVSQLFRYFSVTDAKIAVLTNGIEYQFFTDLDNANVMDKKPFASIDLLNLSNEDMDTLAGFQKQEYNEKALISIATELKYILLIKKSISEEFNSPSDEFTRVLASKFFEGKFTKNTLETFRSIVSEAFTHFVESQAQKKLLSAAHINISDELGTKEEDEPIQNETDIETTDLEEKGFRIVQAIGSEFVQPSRIIARDVKSYFGVLLDDNNRKPICRLKFNNEKRLQISLFEIIDGVSQKELNYDIVNVEDIYKYKKEIKKTLQGYNV